MACLPVCDTLAAVRHTPLIEEAHVTLVAKLNIAKNNSKIRIHVGLFTCVKHYPVFQFAGLKFLLQKLYMQKTAFCKLTFFTVGKLHEFSNTSRANLSLYGFASVYSRRETISKTCLHSRPCLLIDFLL